MPDLHRPRSPGSGHDPLAPLFSGLDDELAPALRPPGPTAARAVVARRSSRRRVAGGVAAALTLVLVVLGTGVLLRGPLRGDSVVVNQPGSSTTASGNTTSSAVPATPPAPPSPEVRPFTKSALQELALTLPGWRGQDACPQGPVRFAGGVAVERDRTLTMLPGVREPVYADVVGDSRQEVVVRIRCAEGTTLRGDALAVLALTPEGGLRAAGYVFAGTPTEQTYVDFSVANRRINLTVGEALSATGAATGRTQLRTYEWNGATFRLIAGPASFPR